MELKELVSATFDRIWAATDRALDGLTDQEIAVRPNEHSNSIGWIAWHMARVEDRWLSWANGKSSQQWMTGWAKRLGMPEDPNYAGGGMTPEQVAQFKTPTVQQLKDYAAATRQATKAYIQSLTPAHFDQEIETFFGRKMTIGQVCSHLVCELNQHAGQIAYLRGYFKGYQGRA